MATVEDLSDGGKKVVSGKSFDRLTQETNSWCYAVTERTVKLAYGVPVGTQKEIATKFCTEVMAVQAPEQKVQEIFDFLKSEEADLDENNRTADEVLRNQAREKALEIVIEGRYGTPNVEGLNAKLLKGSDVSDEALKDTFDNDNLAIQGSGIHWTVVYGYESAKEGYIKHLL